LIIKLSNFIGNTAKDGGGAIYNYAGLMKVTGSKFLNKKANSGGFLYNYSGKRFNVHFNRIVGNTAVDGTVIYNRFGKIDVSFNWWGSNNPKFKTFTYGILDVIYKPWIYMKYKIVPNLINRGSTSKLIASFNQVFDGLKVRSINPSKGHIPDGTPVKFIIKGISVVKYTINGIATAILR
jgi:hypothetical protein